MNVSFIGLGTMGYPMAGHLQRTGAQVSVYNRSIEKAQQWALDYSGKYFSTPREASEGSELVMVCVGNDDDLRSVCYGEDGVLAGLKANAILIDHTTTSSQVAVEVAARCAEQGNEFLDAPVSGGEVGAINGQLTIMAGGSNTAFEKAQTTLEAYSKQLTLLGSVGAGQTCKMVNQLCVAGILQGLSEGLILAQESGLDLEQVRDVLKHGAAQSWQLEQRTHTIAQDKFDFGFAIDWMRKDLGICIEKADSLGVDLPLAKMVDQSYAQLQKQGHNRSDTSVLIKALKPKQ